MQIPFLDLKVQYKSIKTEIDSAIQNILDNTAFVLGKAVSDFETEFAKAHNVESCVALNSGTAGNHIATWALGIGPGDEVIIPANTFIATAWGATLCGAKPVFVDCEPESYNIDPSKIEAAITPKTKAIVAVHLYGQPADMDPLKEISLSHNLNSLKMRLSLILQSTKEKESADSERLLRSVFIRERISERTVKAVHLLLITPSWLRKQKCCGITALYRNTSMKYSGITIEWKVFKVPCSVLN